MFTTEMSDQWCMTACDAPDMASWGGSIGGTAGWNFQSGVALLGIEGDFNSAGFDNHLFITNNSNYDMDHMAEWNWYATVRGRMGLAVGNVLTYVTAGIAVVDADYSSIYSNCSPTSCDEVFRASNTQVGFTGGAGVEFAVNDSLSIKGEYLFIGLPDLNTPYKDAEGEIACNDCQMTYRSNVHLARVGLNYHF